MVFQVSDRSKCSQLVRRGAFGPVKAGHEAQPWPLTWLDMAPVESATV